MQINTRDIENKYKVNKEDVALVEFIHLVFTRMTGKSYRKRLVSLFLWRLCVLTLYNVDSVSKKYASMKQT